MSNAPGTEAGVEPAGEGGNPFTNLAQRPRLMLLLLAGWSILTVLVPFIGSVTLGALVLLHLLQPQEEPPAPRPAD